MTENKVIKIDSTDLCSDDDACVVCNTPNQGKIHDHLRLMYWFKNIEKFDPSFFVPKLTYDEKYWLQSGFHFICSNRFLCRKRQQKRNK